MSLAGVFPVLPTIFTAAGEIDERGVRGVLDYIVDAGAAGIVYPGLASEYDHLTAEERLEMTASVGRWLAGRAQFVVGASAGSAEEAAAFARAGAGAGATAAMIMTPHTLADDPLAMASFYRDVGNETGIAIMLQNAPAPMGIGLSMDAVAALARDVDAIRYVKEEAQPSGQRITGVMSRAGDALDAVFGGAGGRYVIDELVRGAQGTMPACEITEVHVRMLRSFASGEVAMARDLFERTLPLLSVQAVFRWRLTKEVLRRRGLIDSVYTRAPGPELDRHDLAEVDALLGRIADLTGIAVAGDGRGA
ncbi:dihydrodipicolinate synthase family protein [Hephaestia mangrovi]|uniref:dihydrodipicolinate synthase family protein n=1 Tax=Hephaestia mangrovi TaxID=2873268 RepID=UPI001CA75DDD|nr:dihydrodipicolinate synthase family protein [Hephaestia mangrovi]MBY8829539.1 dihydrodipicolinate synthase family protein [Hephaestia mangrovi]